MCKIAVTNNIPSSSNKIARASIETQKSGSSSKSLLDILLVQDLTGTFEDDLPNLRRLAPDVVNSIRKIYPDTWFGVVSFTDKPNNIFEKANKGYIYKTELPLTKDEKEFQKTIDALRTLPLGGDNEEDPLDALLQVSLRATSELGFRQGAHHIAIVVTDDKYHEEGDYSCLAKVPPNDGDAMIEDNGLGEDYASVAQVKTALKNADIIPIFLVASDCLSIYQQLVEELETGTVIALSLNSSNLVSDINEGLTKILGFTEVTMIH